MAAEESGQQFRSPLDQIHGLTPQSTLLTIANCHIERYAVIFDREADRCNSTNHRSHVTSGHPGLFRDRTTLPGSLRWFASSVSPLLLYHNLHILIQPAPATEHTATGFHVECRSWGGATSVITIPRFQATACLTILLSCPLCHMLEIPNIHISPIPHSHVHQRFACQILNVRIQCWQRLLRVAI